MSEKQSNYFSSSAISQSDIKLFIESPELYYNTKVLGNPRKAATTDMQFGSLVDLMLFEREKFEQEYYVIPEGTETRKSTTAGKKFWEDIAITHPDKKIISKADTLEAELMIEKLRQDPTASSLLFNTADYAENQLEIDWVYSGNRDLKLKSKLDRIFVDFEKGKVTIVDYKTTSATNINAFKYSVKKYGYHIQDSFYEHAAVYHLNELGMWNPSMTLEFIFVVQYKEAPYHIMCVELDMDDVLEGFNSWTTALDDIQRCMLFGGWTQKDRYKSEDGIIKIKCFNEWNNE